MTLATYILNITIGIEIAILLYSILRAEWAYREMIHLADTDFEKYMKLVDYNDMIYGNRFWSFDINNFMKEEE